jgi:hypothetical protein
MSIDWARAEAQNERKHWQEIDGLAYQRVFNLPTDFGPDDLPAEGDMLPGEDYALIGPFVEKNGISFRQQRGGAGQQLVLKGKKLATRS